MVKLVSGSVSTNIHPNTTFSINNFRLYLAICNTDSRVNLILCLIPNSQHVGSEVGFGISLA